MSLSHPTMHRAAAASYWRHSHPPTHNILPPHLPPSSLISGSSFANYSSSGGYGLPVAGLPVLVNCVNAGSSSGSSGSSSCNVSITDTSFSANDGTGALAVKLDCSASSCNFEFQRCTFQDHALVGNSGSWAAAALTVTASAPYSTLTLSLTGCTFSANDGAGLSTACFLPTAANTNQSCSLAISDSTFTEHRALSGGLPALSISGYSSVSLQGSSFLSNALGALAASAMQGNLSLTGCSITSNSPNPLTQNTVDIQMADLFVSSVQLIGCSFVGNSGYSTLVYVNGGPAFSAAGAVNIQQMWSYGSPQANAISVLVQACTFSSNTGYLMPGALSVVSAASAHISESVFSDNYGGGMLVLSVAATVVSGSSFSGNYGIGKNEPAFVSTGGGAITFITCTNMQISTSVFSNNSAVNSGGAVMALGSGTTSTSISISESSFVGNQALSAKGGALFLGFVGEVSITESNFTDCSAAVAGGSVYSEAAAFRGINITGCQFLRSVVGVLPPGGWITNPVLFALGPSDIASQPEVQGGGAVYVSQASTLSLTHSSFLNCSATRGRGGGLRIRIGQVTHLSGVSFQSCSAASGGALSVGSMKQLSGMVTSILDCTFSRNAASTQLPCNSSDCIGLDATLVGTLGDGGAASFDGCAVELADSNFSSNSALGRGGALFAQLPSDTSVVTLLTTKVGLPAPEGLPYAYVAQFVGNGAGVAGGAIAMHGYVLNVSAHYNINASAGIAVLDPLMYTLFQGNSAPTGGAISLSECPTATLSQVLFLENQALAQPAATASAYACGSGHGGALCIDGTSRSSVSAHSALFLNNLATFGGGADIHANPSCTPQELAAGCFAATFDAHSGFTGNTAAGGAGGAVFWSHPGNLGISCGGNASGAGGNATAGANSTMGAVTNSNVTACDGWVGNRVTGDGYGPVMATTAFFIKPTTSELPYYTSNQPLLLNVTMQASVTVRPCQLNEYVDPGTGDLCINCTAGSYNLQPSNTMCVTCPAGAACSDACLGSSPCSNGGLENAGFIVPSDGRWHSSMFSDQVLLCPNPSSCTYTSRKQLLQQLQQQQQQQHSLSDARVNTAQPAAPTTSPAAPDPATHATLIGRMRSMLSTPPSEPPTAPQHPLAPPPPPSASSSGPRPTRSSANANTAFTRDFFVIIAANLSTYATTQCTTGYEGRLCASCSPGYGSQGVATCKLCPRIAYNTFYYILATLLTLAILAWTFQSAFSDARSLTLERAATEREEREKAESSSSSDEQSLGDSHAVQNTMQGPSSRSLQVEAGGAGAARNAMQGSSTRSMQAATHGKAVTGKGGSRKAMIGSSTNTSPVKLGLPDWQGSACVPSSQSLTSLGPQSQTLTPPPLAAAGTDPTMASLLIVADPAASLRLHPGTDEGSTAQTSSMMRAPSFVAAAQPPTLRRRAVRGQQRLGVFSDHRDAVIDDSTRAAVVVNRIFVSYLQVLGLLKRPLLYPNSLQHYLQFYSQITSATAVVSLDCSLPDNGTVSKATIRTLVNALAPLYIQAFRGEGHGFKYVTRVFTLTNVVVVFFFYPSAIQALLNIFSCDQIDQHPLPATHSWWVCGEDRCAYAGTDGGTYWRLDYSQQCYQGTHSALTWALGVPGLVLLALGWPVLCAVWLYCKQHKMYVDPRFTGLYSFMFEGYKPEYGWWESVVTMRKLAVATLIVFLRVLDNKGLQLLVVTIVLGVALALQAINMPYEYGHANWLESLSLVVTIVTIYLSLYFSNSLTDAPLAVVTVLVILLNVVTMAIFLYALLRAKWRATSHKRYGRKVRPNSKMQQRSEAGGLEGESREAQRRQPPRWLETHMWHAKRMAMEHRWGHVIAAQAPGKGLGSKALLQAAATGAVMHDASYWGCVELHGARDSIMQMLCLVSDPEDTTARMNHPAVASGTGEAGFLLHACSAFPAQPLGPVQALWCCQDVNPASAPQPSPPNPHSSLQPPQATTTNNNQDDALGTPLPYTSLHAARGGGMVQAATVQLSSCGRDTVMEDAARHSATTLPAGPAGAQPSRCLPATASGSSSSSSGVGQSPVRLWLWVHAAAYTPICQALSDAREAAYSAMWGSAATGTPAAAADMSAAAAAAAAAPATVTGLRMALPCPAAVESVPPGVTPGAATAAAAAAAAVSRVAIIPRSNDLRRIELMGRGADAMAAAVLVCCDGASLSASLAQAGTPAEVAINTTATTSITTAAAVVGTATAAATVVGTATARPVASLKRSFLVSDSSSLELSLGVPSLGRAPAQGLARQSLTPLKAPEPGASSASLKNRGSGRRVRRKAALAAVESVGALAVAAAVAVWDPRLLRPVTAGSASISLLQPGVLHAAQLGVGPAVTFPSAAAASATLLPSSPLWRSIAATRQSSDGLRAAVAPPLHETALSALRQQARRQLLQLPPSELMLGDGARQQRQQRQQRQVATPPPSASCPVQVVRRTYSQMSVQEGDSSSGAGKNEGARLSIIMPAGWATSLWHALAYAGCRPTGQLEWRWMCAQSSSMCFPYDHPHTPAGQQYLQGLVEQHRASNALRPKANRAAVPAVAHLAWHSKALLESFAPPSVFLLNPGAVLFRIAKVKRR
ncbi:MAG: hypothetical protein WDW38_004660 [Sanguina aurantia]